MAADILIRFIADWLVIIIVLAGVAAMFLAVPRPHWYQAFARGLVTGLAALLSAKIISLLYQGERPFVELGVAAKAAYLNNPGFPSDHVLFVFTITAVVWASTKNRTWAAGLLIMSLLVALGRILALVHTPADVAGGIACAAVAAIVVYGRRLFTARHDLLQ